MKRTLILTLGLLACVTVLIAAGTKAPEPTAPQGQQPLDVFAVASSNSTTSSVATADVSDCICPVYPYAYHEGYWSYYAIRCSNCSPGSLDAEPGLPATNCPGCWGNPPGDCPGTCEIVINSQYWRPNVTLKGASHLGRDFVVENIRKNGTTGIGKTGFAQKRSRRHQIRLNKQIAAAQAEFIVKVVRKSGDPFLAKLVLVSIDPQRIPNLPKKFAHLPVRTQGIGFEIDEPATTQVESGNTLTARNGDVVEVANQPHSYLMRYRHVWYHVLCHASHVR